jgi:predicted hydrolase (HD superfamily)
MTREEALNILNSLIKNPSLIKHHLAVESVMKALAEYFKAHSNIVSIKTEDWGLTGLLHDADYDITRYAPERHTLLFEEKYKNKVSAEIIYAIKAHNFKNNGVEPKSLMDWSLYCCDELTGLIIASALVLPDKKLISLNSDFVLKKFRDGTFARGCDREEIKMCEQKLGIPLKDFVEISLKAMQNISNELGF